MYFVLYYHQKNKNKIENDIETPKKNIWDEVIEEKPKNQKRIIWKYELIENKSIPNNITNIKPILKSPSPLTKKLLKNQYEIMINKENKKKRRYYKKFK